MANVDTELTLVHLATEMDAATVALHAQVHRDADAHWAAISAEADAFDWSGFSL